MSDAAAGDNPLRGGEGPGEAPRRPWPPWAVVAAVIGGLFVLASGWAAHVASTNKDLMEARHETITTQPEDIKDRLDRLEDRLVFLEQNRTAAAIDASSSAVASRATGIQRTEGEPSLSPDGAKNAVPAAHGG